MTSLNAPFASNDEIATKADPQPSFVAAPVVEERAEGSVVWLVKTLES